MSFNGIYGDISNGKGTGICVIDGSGTFRDVSFNGIINKYSQGIYIVNNGPSYTTLSLHDVSFKLPIKGIGLFDDAGGLANITYNKVCGTKITQLWTGGSTPSISKYTKSCYSY